MKPLLRAYQRGMLDFFAGSDRNPFGWADQQQEAAAWREGWEYGKRIKETNERERQFELGGAL